MQISNVNDVYCNGNILLVIIGVFVKTEMEQLDVVIFLLHLISENVITQIMAKVIKF